MPEENAKPVSNDEIKKLLEQNLAVLQETNAMVHRINSYITFQRVMSVIYIILIFAPIVIGLIYLPPILKDAFSTYNELINPANPGKFFQ